MNTVDLYSNYFNAYEGRSAVIYGTGPSISKYDNRFDYNSITIGCNAIIYYKQIMDYYFIGDGGTSKRGFYSDEKSYIRYKPKLAKFIRVPPKGHPANEYKPLPENIENSLYYKITGGEPWKNKEEIYFDKSLKTISDCGSIIFEALQFALICGFHKIYLVGCDNTQSYGKDLLDTKNTISDIHYNNINYSWNKFGEFVDKYFNHVDFYCVNPVNLKLFKKVLT